MQIEKNVKPRVMIIAFPSFGFVGNIALEFLKEHLKTEKIGRIFIEEMHPIVAIHKGELIEPVSLYYNRRYNIALLQGISKAVGFENKLGEKIQALVKKLSVKEAITLDGVAALGNNVYYYSKFKDDKVFEDIGLKKLNDGVVLGVTAALLMRLKNITSLFAETQSQLPDSNGAARLIKVLDKYLGLKVDYEPLIEQAKQFEKKLHEILEKSQSAKKKQEESEKLSYFG